MIHTYCTKSSVPICSISWTVVIPKKAGRTIVSCHFMGWGLQCVSTLCRLIPCSGIFLITRKQKWTWNPKNGLPRKKDPLVEYGNSDVHVYFSWWNDDHWTKWCTSKLRFGEEKAWLKFVMISSGYIHLQYVEQTKSKLLQQSTKHISTYSMIVFQQSLKLLPKRHVELNIAKSKGGWCLRNAQKADQS